jgi:hypothetical protein
MGLEGIILNKKSQTPKGKHCIFLHICGSKKKSYFIEEKGSIVITIAWEGHCGRKIEGLDNR